MTLLSFFHNKHKGSFNKKKYTYLWKRVEVRFENKNVLRFALNSKRGELLEREGEIVFGYYTWVTYYP